MKLYKAAHTVYKTQYYIVWITRYRRKILITGVKSYLKIKLQEIRKYYPDWEYIEIGSTKDKVCFLEKGILGQKRHLGKRVFCLYGRDKRRSDPKMRPITRKGRNRKSKAWVLNIPRLQRRGNRFN